MTLKEIDMKMTELAKFAIPSKNYNEEKAEEYYKMQELFWIEKNKQVKASKNKVVKVAKTFINSYGEATKREITNQSYKRQQRKQSREILNFII